MEKQIPSGESISDAVVSFFDDLTALTAQTIKETGLKIKYEQDSVYKNESLEEKNITDKGIQKKRRTLDFL